MKKIGVALVRGLILLFSKLPLRCLYGIGSVFSWFAAKVFHYREGVVMTNLARSFPELPYWDLESIADAYYRHMGDIIAETIWFGGSDYDRIRKQRICTIANPEVLNEAFESSPGVVILNSHCGNWEIMGGLLGYRTATGGRISFEGKHISVVYKKLKNPVSDEVFKLNRISPLEQVGTECEVESSNVLRFSIRHKDEKRVYVYPTDQAPYTRAGKHPIGEFMHQQTNAMLGSVGVACKLSHAVAYMKMKRVERGRYEMSFIPMCDDASKVTPEELMKKYYQLLEEEINETPANWLWSHKRWK